jgi:hypothetical protein
MKDVTTISNHREALDEFLKWKSELPYHFAKNVTNIEQTKPVPIIERSSVPQSTRIIIGEYNMNTTFDETPVYVSPTGPYTTTKAINYKNQLNLLASTFNADKARIKGAYAEFATAFQTEKENAAYSLIVQTYTDKINSLYESITVAVTSDATQLVNKQYPLKARDAVAHYAAKTTACSVFALSKTDGKLRMSVVYNPDGAYLQKDLDFYSALIDLEMNRTGKDVSDAAETNKAYKRWSQLIGTTPIAIEILELERLQKEVVRVGTLQAGAGGNKGMTASSKILLGLQEEFADRELADKLKQLQ